MTATENFTATSSGVVYFIRPGDLPLVKIGWTENLTHRLAVMQTGNHEPLWVDLAYPGSRHNEYALHASFDAARQIGEWFRLTPEITAHIEAHRAIAPDAMTGVVPRPMTEAEAVALAEKFGW